MKKIFCKTFKKTRVSRQNKQNQDLPGTIKNFWLNLVKSVKNTTEKKGEFRVIKDNKDKNGISKSLGRLFILFLSGFFVLKIVLRITHIIFRRFLNIATLILGNRPHDLGGNTGNQHS